MAQDIIPMIPEEAKCPCCGMPLLVEWQIATYGEGSDSFQFVGLELDTKYLANALRKKTYKPKTELVQLQNPITKHWVVIDKTTGSIVKHSRMTRPYKHIKIVRSAKPIVSKCEGME